MIQDMKTILTRLFTVAVLMMVSMAVGAQVKVEIDTFTGGVVAEKSQTAPSEDGSVVVTITVTPDPGYMISRDDVMVAATVPPSVAATRSPQIAMMLALAGEDPEDLSQPRDYTFTVEAGFGAWVHTADFRPTTVEEGVYRICIDDNVKWYLWPSVTTDDDGYPYLTTFNGVTAPALDYPSTGVAYEAFDETFSRWRVTPVDADGLTCYQLFNVGLQQYAVWSAAEGLRAVHLEAAPADERHTWFRFDGSFPHVRITPIDAAAGTTLNSKFGDKAFLSASGQANAATGYPNGEPNHNGEGGLIQIYDGTPVWTLEDADNYVSISFQKISESGLVTAALFVPTSNAVLPSGVSAYLVTGIDEQLGIVQLEKVDYLPANTPVLLLATGDVKGFTLLSKRAVANLLTDDEKGRNRLRVGSPTVQPKAYEDYIFFRGEFVMVSGGTLSTGKVFLDMYPEKVARSRGVVGIGDASQTTGMAGCQSCPQASVRGWYTLTGSRISGRPTKKGIYLYDGKKQIVR